MEQELMLKCFICFVSDSGLGAPTAYSGSVHTSSGSRDYDDGGSQRKFNLDGLPRFDKNFYKESPAVRAMTEEEVNEYRQRREITVEGRDVPKPVTSFHDVGFPGTLFLILFQFHWLSSFHLVWLWVVNFSSFMAWVFSLVSFCPNLCQETVIKRDYWFQ